MTVLASDPQWLAFLAAIRANLADDTVRLVACDFLDEHSGEVECERCKGEGSELVRSEDRGGLKGGSWSPCPKCSGSGRVSNGFAEYAEFVRIQCYQGTQVYIAGDIWMEPQTGRDAELVRDHQIVWTPIDAIRDFEFTWIRGFIDEIRCPMSTWIEHGAKIVRLPTAAVRKVVVTDREPDRVPDPLPFTFWRTVGTVNPRSLIPEEIFDRMSGKVDEHMTPFGWLSDPHKHYETADLAHAALSDACLSWAWASEPAVNV